MALVFGYHVYEQVYVYEMLCMNQQRDHLIYHYQWRYRIQAGVWLTQKMTIMIVSAGVTQDF